MSNPETPVMPAPLDLRERGDDLLSTARDGASGRAASNLVPGGDNVLSQTLLALVAGGVLADHVAPGPASLQVLSGRGALTVDDQRSELATGDWVPIPLASHGLEATTDLVCLLTVARPGSPPDS